MEIIVSCSTVLCVLRIRVSANPRELILIASTFTGIEISHQIFIVLFGLSRKCWSPGKLVRWTNFFMEYWSFAENFGPRADQYSMENWSIVGPRFSA